MLPGKDPTVIINAVVVEEPEGYRGRRRRFLLTRKGGGLALPALLVAASVVVVLIVVGVSQLLPRDAAGQIPIGGGTPNGPVSGDDGQPQNDGSTAGTPGGSATPGRSPGGKATPSPSGGVSVAPALPGVPPVVGPTTPTPSPSSSATTAPPFPPVNTEAEKATLAGTATRWSCTTCSGGSKVRFIGNSSGTVTVSVPGVPAAGQRQLVVTYELGDTNGRWFYLSVNGAAGVPVKFTSNTTDWNAPLTANLQVSLTAGSNTIRFYNPTTNAPDLDKITVE